MTWESSRQIGGPDAGRTYADLLGIVDAAISLQSEIEVVMRACLSRGPKGAPLARQAARLTSALIVLIDRSEGLPATLLVDEARGLLRYHHRLLAETVSYAYSVSAVLNPGSATKFSDNLGDPARRLRRLRSLVAEYLGGDRAVPPFSDDGQFRLPAQISHTLRTPLTTILGNTSSLLQNNVTWDDDTRQDLLRGMVAQSARLDRVVDNVLTLASINSGSLQPDFDWCDPAALLQAVAAGVDSGMGGQSRITLSVSLPDNWAPEGLVWADHVLLGRAIANAVDNGLRHNPPPTRVTLSGRVESKQLVVTVSDDGQGLPAAVTAAIARTGAAGVLPTDIGTGIATTIGLVRAHGGTVSFLPVPAGTRCVITVALERAGSSST